VVNGMKWVSRQHYHQERGVAVFLGAGNFSQGGWKAGAVRAGFRKVVEQPSRPSTDPRPDRLVIVDEFRTSRVSSSVHARQPCELHLPPNQPRPADWVPPAGQVNHRLLRPAWSLRHAKCVRGLKWCHEVPPNPPPPPPAPLAQDPPAPAQPPPLGQDPPPAPAQDPPPLPPAQDPPPPVRLAQAQPPPAAQDQPPAQPPPGPVQRPQAPLWGRWLDRDTNPCLNFQRIGESMQRPLELCSWTDLEALPPIGNEYHQRYKLVNDRLPKGKAAPGCRVPAGCLSLISVLVCTGAVLLAGIASPAAAQAVPAPLQGYPFAVCNHAPGTPYNWTVVRVTSDASFTTIDSSDKVRAAHIATVHASAGPRTPPAKQREERRAEWKTQRRQVIKVPGGAVLRGCKKTRRKLLAHFQLRAGIHSQLRVIALSQSQSLPQRHPPCAHPAPALLPATPHQQLPLGHPSEVSMERHGHAKQLVVFFGAASIGTRGGWGADAVLRACRKVVCRTRGTDQRRGRVVLVDEHRTSRVSSAVNGQQPCERQLNKRRATRPAGWKPPAGQVEPRLVRPAWSQQREQPVRGMMWCPVVPPRKPPHAPRSSQAATQPAAASEPGPSTPLPAKRTKRTKAEPEAAEPTKGKGKASKAKPAPQPGRWLDRDCNAALNMQRIGESRWRPLELCYWPDQGALPAKGKEEEGMAEVSMERHGHAKQLVVFFGAASIGTRGGWGADAVLRACRKVVCRTRGTDQRRGRVVLVDEHRTSRVSSAVNGQQPCERQLNKRRATRPAGWKPPAGQVEPRLVRPAWSQQREQPVRGMMWCPVVPPRKPPQAPRSSQAATQPAAASEPGPSTPLPAKRTKRTKAEPEAAEPTKGKGKASKAKPAPQPGRWLDRDCNAALNMQRIGESRWRPLELCYWPDQGALPAKGKEYPGLGYKRLRDKPPKAQQQQAPPI
ncbi:hypothetical protein QJQ45_018300, partial [Haematococcus lacustris]